MQAKVFCKTVAKDVQAYYVRVDGEAYFLFRMPFHRSNNDFFRKGVNIDKLCNYAGAHSTTVRKTLDKLPAYLRYIEREYSVPIYTKKKNRQNKTQVVYNRKKFRWQDYMWEVA